MRPALNQSTASSSRTKSNVTHVVLAHAARGTPQRRSRTRQRTLQRRRMASERIDRMVDFQAPSRGRRSRRPGWNSIHAEGKDGMDLGAATHAANRDVIRDAVPLADRQMSNYGRGGNVARALMTSCIARETMAPWWSSRSPAVKAQDAPSHQGGGVQLPAVLDEASPACAAHLRRLRRRSQPRASDRAKKQSRSATADR